MSRSDWKAWIKHLTKGFRRKRAFVYNPRRITLTLEELEDRLVPTPIYLNTFPLPTGQNGVSAMTFGRDGNLWFGAPGLQSVTEYPAGASLATGNFGSLGLWSIITGPDGNLWFTENLYSAPNAIGVFNPNSHTVTGNLSVSATFFP